MQRSVTLTVFLASLTTSEGVICCRFANPEYPYSKSDEIAALGQFFAKHRQALPRFVVSPENKRTPSHVTHTVDIGYEDMIARGRFCRPVVKFEVKGANVSNGEPLLSAIYVDFRGSSRAGDAFLPISGFPRVILNDKVTLDDQLPEEFELSAVHGAQRRNNLYELGN